MAKKVQYRRLLMLAVLLGIAFAGLGYRLVDLQVLQHDGLRAEAQTVTHREFQLEPRRGDIYDRRGNLLATSTFVKTVCADPALLGDQGAGVARLLAPLLGTNEAALLQRLAPRVHANEKGRSVTNHYVVLARKVPLDTWQKIHELMSIYPATVADRKLSRKELAFYRDLRLGGVFAEPFDDQLRTYPNGTLAAHVLGYVGLAGSGGDNARASAAEGIDGIERAFNAKLTGVRGWRVTERDGHHRELVDLREQEVAPRDGLSVGLTIDSVLQSILESAMAEAMEREKPLNMTGLIVRPATGEVLAMAAFPNFDPNDLTKTPLDARRNRVIADFHEPGSVFKLVVVSGALNESIVQLTDTFNCENGVFFYAGHTLHDSSRHGVLTTEGIITKSSNIGAAKIGILMGETNLYRYIRDFGFGIRTGIPLPSETAGIVWAPGSPNWTKVSIAQLPMGQGVAVTPLQMTMAMCAVANKGVLMRPMIVDRLLDSDGKTVAQYAPEVVRRVVSEATARQMVEALKTVTTSEGTAARAALEHYTVAGKTGTAQKPPYHLGKWYASFAGFLPADDPEICIYIAMDEPNGPSHLHQGGQVCAPVFKAVAEKAASYLNLRPDKGGDPGVLPGGVARGEAPVRTAAARLP